MEAVELGGVCGILQSRVFFLKRNNLSVLLRSIARKSSHSLTSRSSLLRTLQRKPSSPSKTRGYSTSCLTH